MPTKDLAPPSTNTPLREPRKVSVNTMLTRTEAQRLKEIARSRKATRSTVVRDAVLSLIERTDRRESDRRQTPRRETDKAA